MVVTLGRDQICLGVMSELDSIGSTDSTAEKDWPAKTSEMVVHYVGSVREKTTGPALVASRYAVYFLAIGLIASVLLILALILLLRVLVLATGYLPFIDAGEPWLAYVILGVIFTLVGGLLWKKRVVRD